MDSLMGVGEPQDQDLREPILRQLPKETRDAVVKKEIENTQDKHWVEVHFPPAADRPAALEWIGEELGLRIRDIPNSRKEDLRVNCLTEELVSKAMEMDGMTLTNPGGREVGTLTIHRVRSVPMGPKELMAVVDSLVWGAYEVQRMSAKDEKRESREPRENRGKENQGRQDQPREQRGAWQSPEPRWAREQWGQKQGSRLREVQSNSPPRNQRGRPESPNRGIHDSHEFLWPHRNGANPMNCESLLHDHPGW